MSDSADERLARAALSKGFCPDCRQTLEERDGAPGYRQPFGWCPACTGYWVDGDISLQVSRTRRFPLIDIEHWRNGKRRRLSLEMQ